MVRHVGCVRLDMGLLVLVLNILTYLIEHYGAVC